MPFLELVAVPCQISRGGFSQELIFEFPLYDGQIHVGDAPRHYCWDTAGRTIDIDEPKPGRNMTGLVAARLLQKEGDRTLVSIPDGEVVHVNVAVLQPRPGEPARHVPV